MAAIALAGNKSSELEVQGPDIPRGKFLNASARRSNCSPFRSANRHASLIVRELLI